MSFELPVINTSTLLAVCYYLESSMPINLYQSAFLRHSKQQCSVPVVPVFYFRLWGSFLLSVRSSVACLGFIAKRKLLACSFLHIR